MSRKLKMVPVSTHDLGRALLGRPDMIARTRLIGPFTVMWNGKPGDVRPTISFEEFMGEPASTTGSDQ